MKRILTRLDIHKYAIKIGDMKRGTFKKFEGVDLKENGFYLVVDDKTGRVVFRFYVAPNQRRKTGAVVLCYVSSAANTNRLRWLRCWKVLLCTM